jgi:chemotaxis response regulator CheB
LKKNGNHTIAQNRATSAVYGMPGAAAEIEAATEILALDKIAPAITKMMAKAVRTHV